MRKIATHAMNAYAEYPFEIIAFLLCAVGYVLYISIVYSTEVLFLGSFYGDVQLIEKFLNGSIVSSDLFRRFGEHGMLGYDILLLINAALFHYSSRFDLVINCLNVIFCGFFILSFVTKSISDKNIVYYCGLSLIAIVMFSTMQGSSATMETQVRLGVMCFLISTYFINEVLLHEVSYKTFLYAVASILVSINIFGTLYSFAAIPTVFLLVLLFSIAKKHIDSKHFMLILTYAISVILYCYMYQFIIGDNTGSHSIRVGIIFWLSHPIEVLKSILAWNASAVLGYAVIVDKIIPDWLYLSIGMLISCIYMGSVFLFIKVKMYEKTTVPILLFGYSFTILFLIMIGRYNGGWAWSTSYWYHVHTKFGLAASIWILMFAFSKKPMFNSPTTIVVMNCLILIAFTVIARGLYLGISADLNRAQNVIGWYQNIASYMPIAVENMPIDANGNTPLYADRVTTKTSLDILKKYKLSVFNHTNGEIKPSTDLTHKSKLLSGSYSKDGWIPKTLTAKMYTGSKGKLTGTISFPQNYYLPNAIEIFINNEKVYSNQYTNVGDYWFTINCQPNQDVLVEIVMEKAIVPNNLKISPDLRELSAILKDFHFS